jgi:hypothetical protein
LKILLYCSQLFTALAVKEEDYNTLFITEFDIETRHAAIKARKAVEAFEGYQRGKETAEMDIIVNASNIVALSDRMPHLFQPVKLRKL